MRPVTTHTVCGARNSNVVDGGHAAVHDTDLLVHHRDEIQVFPAPTATHPQTSHTAEAIDTYTNCHSVVLIYLVKIVAFQRLSSHKLAGSRGLSE